VPDETDTALAAFGLQLDDTCKRDTTTWVWPQHWDTVALIIAMRTQWRTGMAGPTGLDYNVLPLVAKKHRISLTRKRFAQLQVIETEMLNCMRADRERK
jgi:hypothetical protein